MFQRVTIGLPVYNGENYLRIALDAMVHQTFEEWALYISDNASTDGTRQICEEFSADDRRVTYARQERNLGAAPNYNVTFTASEPTEYFGWLSHDDVPAKDFLEQCVAALDSNPDAIGAFGGIVDIDSSGTGLAEHPPRLALMSSDPVERLRDVIDHSNTAPIFSVVRRALLEETNLHGSYTGSDRTLMAEIALRGPIVALPDALFEIREHPDRSTRSSGNPWKGHLREGWFDTSRQGRIVFPNWRRVQSMYGAVRNAPLDRQTRRACRKLVTNWVRSRHWKPLVFDLILAARSIPARLLRRS